ncbi:RcpC/CpaB family pilus assembly protein [Arthrobacter sp. zg-Y20]|uniref:RcpC/CpaB family pilus assembly protein n=1 Tax=unclassified Arthrobacter TaxID=235627 RepID=UPI001D15402B|nr:MULTISPECIES: RcpC/CpaB family pilus assembly protein [unclassified Arthrobacter]MCC3276156.1 RcpC/CpaB family pilus assembly protein [Arthrobacter sp. zg-Y20]MDK1316316.1 RcpC/CpaB family pilus assembly protein [Arthrobacter sp. zg.Y20]WIB05407.1 RcpC/CpaB family pilus assembly protein [Arthrobacter sp. zg-Y20]
MPFRRRIVPGPPGSAPSLFTGDRAVGVHPHSRRRRLRRFVARRRRLLAALACCAAAGVAVQALIPPDAERTVVVRAARDLPAGAVLEAGSLATASIPSEAVPPGAHDTLEPLVGRRLATPLLRGSPVTEISLAGSGLLAGAPPGTVAVPLRPADPSVLGLLGPGQLVTVVAASGEADYSAGAAAQDSTAQDGAVVLATAVPVLWVSGASPGAGFPGAGSAAGDWTAGAGEGLVVVAADREDAARLTAASGTGGIYLVLTGG